jgi:tetratricopeptide (TPR) repeat protein
LADVGRPDPRQAGDLGAFIALLGELRAWAGQPSFRVLARRAGPLLLPPRTVAHSTVADAFQSRRRRLDLDLVTAIVRVLGLPDAEVALWRDTAARLLASGSASHDGDGKAGALRQLPAELAVFTGREREVQYLLSAAGREQQQSAAPVIVVIEGMGGVGKTQLALRAAHELVRSGRYGDGQLYVNLRGFGTGQPPADPSAVLDSFLRALGVPARQIPAGREDRAAMFRDRSHGRSLLIVLDNAAAEDQVRDLIPASPACLVLVTSRRSIAGLAGAAAQQLGLFSGDEALCLLSRIAGEERVSAEPEAARQVVDACGRLALAVALAAYRLRSRPAWDLARLAARLSGGREEGYSQSLNAVFSLSYQDLPPPARSLFRLLSAHPGSQCTAVSAAALAGIGEPDADRLLERLCDEHLLEQPSAGRFEFHDLLRAFAAGCCAAEDDPGIRAAAVTRVLAWYLHTADRATRILAPRRRALDLNPAPAAVEPMSFWDFSAALDWCEAERAELVAAVFLAADSAGAICWQLSVALAGFFSLRTYWADWHRTSQAALGAAVALGDRRAEALVLTSLGRIAMDLDDYPGALDRFGRVLELHRQAGDRVGEARMLVNIGAVHGKQGNADACIENIQHALPLLNAADDSNSASVALANLAMALTHTGRHQEAYDCARQALAVRERTGDRYGAAASQETLGFICVRMGRLEEALRWCRQSVAEQQAIGDVRGVAHTLGTLADALEATGDTAQADDTRRAATQIQQELVGGIALAVTHR